MMQGYAAMQFESPWSADQTWQAVLAVLPQAGVTITVANYPTVTGYMIERRRPSVIVAVVLFLLCFIPGIIYLMSAGKDQTHAVSVTVGYTSEGSWITVDGEPYVCKAVASQMNRALR